MGFIESASAESSHTIANEKQCTWKQPSEIAGYSSQREILMVRMMIDHQRQQLYGRKQEVAFLREWSLGGRSPSQSGTATGASRLLLLGGARGVGKRALARSLLLSPPDTKGGKATAATRANARFLCGRFYPSRAEKGLPPGRPMSAFWDALNLLFDVNDLAETESLQSAILSEFKQTDDIETLMEMMPASKRLLVARRGSTASELSEGPPTRTVPEYVKSKRMLSTGLVALAVRFVRSI
jgi:hypothetical protein